MTDGERIARLERANRRLAWGVGAAVLAALLGAGRGRVAKLEADRIDVRRLFVVDGDGRVLASLAEGRGEAAGGAVLGIDGPDGRGRVLVGVGRDGSASLHAVQRDGRGVSLLAPAEGPASVVVAGPGGDLTSRLPARP